MQEPWVGRIWLNPPYGTSTRRWIERLAKHNRGTLLIFARVETDYWKRWIWPYAQLVCFIYGRLKFYFPDGSRACGDAGGPSALVAFGAEDARILEKSEIDGAYVVPRNKFTAPSPASAIPEVLHP
jgi:hypothetical protein